MPLTEPQIFSYNAPVGSNVGSVSYTTATQQLSALFFSFTYTIWWPYFLPWRWMQQAPRQCCHLSTKLHGIISHKTVIF